MKILCITKSIFPKMEASSECVYNLINNNEVDYITINDSKYIFKQKNIYSIENNDIKLDKLLSRCCITKLAKFTKKVYYKFRSFRKTSIKLVVNGIKKSKVLELIDKIFEKNTYDFMISVSAPFECHVVAMWIKEKYNKTKWFAYEVDPFVYNFTSNQKARSIYNRKMIANYVFKNTNGLFYMPQIKQFNIKMGYCSSYHKNSIQLELPKIKSLSIVKKDYFKNNKINIVYTGVFYKKIRNPDKMLALFSRLKSDFVLHIYGNGCKNILDKYKKLMGERLVFHGYCSNNESLQAIVNSDVLVTLGNSCENQIPSKIFDYFATGNPIINFMQIENDTSKDYMTEYGNAVNVDLNNSISNNICIVEHFLKRLEYLPYNIVEKRMTKYTIEEIEKDFFIEIKGILDENNTKTEKLE